MYYIYTQYYCYLLSFSESETILKAQGYKKGNLPVSHMLLHNHTMQIYKYQIAVIKVTVIKLQALYIY